MKYKVSELQVTDAVAELLKAYRDEEQEMPEDRRYLGMAELLRTHGSYTR